MPAERWVDAGSGAGFPGLVLAACYPRVEFTLLEPLKRRAGFLELQIAALGLENTTIEPRRIQEVEEAEYDVAVARALADPGEALRLMVRLLVRQGGEVLVAVGGDPVGADVSLGPHVRSTQIEGLGDVDSPGRFLMMTREE